MKSYLAVILSALALAMLVTACATTNNPGNTNAISRTGTPSPLNTSANPWTQVNPQIQTQMQATRGATP